MRSAGFVDAAISLGHSKTRSCSSVPTTRANARDVLIPPEKLSDVVQILREHPRRSPVGNHSAARYLAEHPGHGYGLIDIEPDDDAADLMSLPPEELGLANPGATENELTADEGPAEADEDPNADPGAFDSYPDPDETSASTSGETTSRRKRGSDLPPATWTRCPRCRRC